MKRRILIIVENIPVPFDTRVWMEAVSLQANGYEVSVLSPRGKGAEQRHEVLEGIHIFRHPMPREGNSAPGYVYRIQLRPILGVSVHVLDLSESRI